MSLPLPFAPMPKCLRKAAEVASVRSRARDLVSTSLGSAAEMWIGVSSFARQCSESGACQYGANDAGGALHSVYNNGHTK